MKYKGMEERHTAAPVLLASACPIVDCFSSVIDLCHAAPRIELSTNCELKSMFSPLTLGIGHFCLCNEENNEDGFWY